MRKKLVQYAVAAVMVLVAGCARPPATEPPTPATPPVVARPASPVQVPANETLPAPSPVTRQELKALTPDDKWPTPRGKLDEETFVELSARYMAAVVSLPEPRRTQDNLLTTLELILADAHVSPDRFRSYAEQVSRDPARKKRTGERIVKLVEDRTGVRLSQDNMRLPEGAPGPAGSPAGPAVVSP